MLTPEEFEMLMNTNFNDSNLDQEEKHIKVATGNYNIRSIMQLVNFYEKNADRLEPVREKMEVEGMPYPQMKMIDMGFWQVGFDLDTNKGIKNAH